MRALEAMRAQPPDLVLLDIELPDRSGLEVCRALLQEPATRGVRVVFISAHDGSAEKAAAYAAGGSDYLRKPFDAEEVRARAASQLAVARLQRENAALRAELDALRRSR
jgi:DNA-binding response OmpR family regulator